MHIYILNKMEKKKKRKIDIYIFDNRESEKKKNEKIFLRMTFTYSTQSL